MKISQLLNKQNNNLDLIRVFLAILVIVGHTIPLNGGSESWFDPLYLFEFTYSGAFAVKLFFFISGLVVTNSYLKKNDVVYYLISRVFRILPLLFFVLVITVFAFGPILTRLPIANYFSELGNFSYIWKNLLFNTKYYLPGIFNENLTPDVVNGSLWSLKYEIGCYIAVLISFIALRQKNKYYLNIPILIVIADAFFTEGLFYHYLGDSSEINLTPASFAIGAFLAVNSDFISINYKSVIITAILYYVFRDSHINHILLIICAASITIFISSNKHVLKLKPKYDISYGIYLWGFLIQQTLYQYFGHLNPYLHCLLAIIITLILGFASFVFIEKPFMTLGKNFYKKYKKLTPETYAKQH
ncbi:acyltransferase family protein [Psychroserpens mesophilus]|uniref:acyltransferase family protein n=1 Tax=Psychroserpens mesophilus TaxID=325473 RepID=UPI0006943499|nr:acyltransferase [Psychroserpens mesophilus]